VSLSPGARSGHELPVYPSYYPHEIVIETIDRTAAGRELSAGKLHAYLSKSPVIPAGAANLEWVASLGSLVLLSINPSSAASEERACAVARGLLRKMHEDGGELIVHPYPVTPMHGDYLDHADLAEAAAARYLAGASEDLGGLKVRAEGGSASLIRPELLANGEDWDAAITAIDVGHLVASAMFSTNAWLGPRWVRMGWYHAYRVLADTVDEARRRRVEEDVQRLTSERYEGAVARINLERDLLATLTASCRTLVAGYTLKRNYFNDEFSAGVENIGYDALEGFVSPMFLRTVKLKDFPWNGWLRLGIDVPGKAAWNPVAGFGDEFGRLMWFAVGDPALLPSPYDAGWTLNRFSQVSAAPQ